MVKKPINTLINKTAFTFVVLLDNKITIVTKKHTYIKSRVTQIKILINKLKKLFILYLNIILGRKKKQ